MSQSKFPAQNKKLLETFSHQGFYNNETLGSWLAHDSSRYGNLTAITAPTGTINYDELSTKVASFAVGLQSLGLGKGDIIAVQLPNIPEYIISYLAIAAIGGLMQTLHMPYRGSELRYLLNDSRASAVICLSEFKNISPAATFLDLARLKNNHLQVVTIGASIKDAIDFYELNKTSKRFAQVDIQTDDHFVLLYTSGTTSLPKGVPHRYNNFLTNARLCREEYGFDHTDRLLSIAPMTHLYGLFTYNMTLSSAATAVLLPSFSPEDFVNTVKEQEPTAIFAAPAHFSTCFQADLLKEKDFENVKFVCLSGSTVPPVLAQRVDALLVNGKVGQLWGMSELQAGTITRLNDTETVRCNTGGRATPGTELRIVDPHDQVLPVDTEGELQIRGLSVFDGYLNNPDETKKALSSDGWFNTGDLGVLDLQGNLRITGRTKHLINRGGIKYNPIEIEKLINELPHIHQCAIIPIADEVYGEKACIFVVTQGDKIISLEDICIALDAADVAKFKWPEQLQLIDAMPMTPTNKIKLDELKKQLN